MIKHYLILFIFFSSVLTGYSKSNSSEQNKIPVGFFDEFALTGYTDEYISKQNLTSISSVNEKDGLTIKYNLVVDNESDKIKLELTFTNTSDDSILVLLPYSNGKQGTMFPQFLFTEHINGRYFDPLNSPFGMKIARSMNYVTLSSRQKERIVFDFCTCVKDDISSLSSLIIKYKITETSTKNYINKKMFNSNLTVGELLKAHKAWKGIIISDTLELPCKSFVVP